MRTVETKAITNCAECYNNKHMYPLEWRSMACNKLHLVLLAKLSRTLNFWLFKKGFTHWPAKLLSIDRTSSSTSLKVIFFESSEIFEISAHDCWIYSTKPANSLNKRFYNHNYIEPTLKVNRDKIAFSKSCSVNT